MAYMKLGWEAHMEQERQQQEMEEHMYALTREALIEAAKHLKQEQLDVLMYHCGFTDNDLKGAAK